MSLPPGFLDELRSRSSLSQVVGRKVVWDARKSNQGKGDMWAPCPFHQEKSASFHVDDRKGFYYCFGCHAKGDAISFVRETENVGFMEAVEILAREAGMPMPERDPRAQEKADKRSQLAEVMEQAVNFFRLQLNTGGAAEARAYLDRRGLNSAALERWEIGYAPDQWQGLWDHLKAKNVEDQLILDAGLAKPSTKGGKPYDTFRGRIIYPIRDARGRAIAFGGRAMDPNDNAKYLNSPETELFDKGRSLYNQGPARTAAGKGQPLIVAEGYMDVIALASAGFEASVAPLGTAITENQLQMLWRIAPEPIIALDGDTAGLRAAMRLIDLALPLLEAGQSLRFAIMPAGKDPDDLLREQGAPALQKLLDEAMPMVQLLWRRETEGKNYNRAEQFAATSRRITEITSSISDPYLRESYKKELRNYVYLTERAKSNADFKTAIKSSSKGQEKPKQTTKASVLAASDDIRTAEHLREAVILAALASCPEVIEEFEAGVEQMRCHDPLHGELRDVLLRHMGMNSEDLREQISGSLGAGALENLLQQRHVAIVPCIRTPGNVDKTRMTVAEELAKLHSARGLDAEIAEAVEDLGGVADEGLTWRLSEAARAADMARRSGQEDRAEYDVADNGAVLSRDERRRLDDLLDQIKIEKPRKG